MTQKDFVTCGVTLMVGKVVRTYLAALKIGTR
jgi:hypothetical protein